MTSNFTSSDPYNLNILAQQQYLSINFGHNYAFPPQPNHLNNFNNFWPHFANNLNNFGMPINNVHNQIRENYNNSDDNQIISNSVLGV